MKRSFYSRHSVNKLLTLCILLGLFPFLLGANYSIPVPITRIIFLHHSCGANLIEQGNVRQGLDALGYEFYDHGYNDDGLRLADGSYTGDNFDVPGDNTDPDGFAEIFAQPLHDPPDNTFSHLMQYDVIAFKSCYPASNIWGDEHLAEYKSYYLAIRDRMDQYPDKIFIVVTQPPQVPGDSDLAEAERARAFANWLPSDEYLAGHPNVFTFDFFGHLAGGDNFLRTEYRYDDYDGHPNEQANRAIGPLFVDFIDQAIQSYGIGAPRPTTAAPTQPPEPTTPPPEEATQPPVDAAPAAGVIDNFESGGGYWETSAETGSTIECRVDTETAHGGAASLHLDYGIEQYGWADCGQYFDPVQDWSGGAGLSLWVRSEHAGEWVTLMLFSGDPDGPTPFEAGFETMENWTQVVLPWSDFARAEWADEGGLSEVDPARVTGYGFSIGADDADSEGIIWIDDIGLATGEEPAEEPIAEPIAEPVEESVEEPGSGGGICSSAALLPLGALGILLAGRRRGS